jgi:uncharacterized membrane protein SpoIIM required for sporulation
MVSAHWIEKRKAHWERLEQLVQRSQTGLARLNHAELQELGILYRQTATDLSVVMEDAASSQLGAYLNQLLARSHNTIYLGRRASAGGILSFYRETYPRIFRETLPMTALAVAIFVLSAVAGWAVTVQDPGFAQRLLGPAMMDTIERREMWTHSIVSIKPVAASAITTNNLSVAFLMFASGITVIGPLWLGVINGLLMGVVGAATWRAGMALSLWSFVAPHGSLELPAIFIASGAGLEIARGLLFPGMLPRKESVVRAGGRASKLILGTIPLLLVAGAIEGFFSPTDAPAVMKFSLGAVLFAALAIYLFKPPRENEKKHPHPHRWGLGRTHIQQISRITKPHP